jgi:hypothetical protein
MFTFSAGFEAATLKIPNKDQNAYANGNSNSNNANNGGTTHGRFFAATQDPYSTTEAREAWPASADDAGTQNHLSNGAANAPTRKQIIGFAKFRTRDEALHARDILQGRRVDIEKGAVLKAEMAKKNLHTKRGVGPLPVNGSQVPAALPQGIAHPPGLMPQQPIMNGHPVDQVTVREREMSISGIGGQSIPWRNNVSEANTLAMANSTRGARERAEEEERDRRRRERDMALRAGNSAAFDAFHSVPAELPLMARHPSEQGPWNDDSTLGPWEMSRRDLQPVMKSASDQSSPNQTSPASQGNGLPSASRSRTSSVTEESHGNASGPGGDADGDLALNIQDGNTSPQLPSPTSVASGSTRNGVDQYPPVSYTFE